MGRAVNEIDNDALLRRPGQANVAGESYYVAQIVIIVWAIV